MIEPIVWVFVHAHMYRIGQSSNTAWESIALEDTHPLLRIHAFPKSGTLMPWKLINTKVPLEPEWGIVTQEASELGFLLEVWFPAVKQRLILITFYTRRAAEMNPYWCIGQGTQKQERTLSTLPEGHWARLLDEENL